jgi:hypothetical protein
MAEITLVAYVRAGTFMLIVLMRRGIFYDEKKDKRFI